MKNLVCLFFVVFLASACSSDHFFAKSPDLSKATVENPARFKVWFESIPDPDKKLECGLPASGTIKGHCNLMGDVIQEKSPFTIWNWHWDPDSPRLRLIESIEGTVTGINGDSYYFTGLITNNVNDKSFYGIMYINGGVGTLDGITGECYISGSSETGVAIWTAEGSVSLRKTIESPIDLPKNKGELLSNNSLVN